MRERLIELLKSNNASPEKTCPRYGTGKICDGCKYLTDDTGCDYIAREADYLLDDGIIVPPCKIGQTVYKIVGSKIHEYKVDYFDIFINKVCDCMFKIHLINDIWSDFVFSIDFGKTVYLTREEAEVALRKEGVE